MQEEPLSIPDHLNEEEKAELAWELEALDQESEEEANKHNIGVL